MSVGAMLYIDDDKKVSDCRIVAGSLFDRPQRINDIEEIFTGKELTKELIAQIEKPLHNIIDASIGTRWSSEYKTPVFINLCKDVLKGILVQIKK